MSVNEREAILASIAPLKQQARERGQFLFCPYQQLWFTADELDELNAKGQFVWGAGNWTVRDPAENTKILQDRVASAEKALADWLKRMPNGVSS